MLFVYGKKLDFDLTLPGDLHRFRQACEHLMYATGAVAQPPEDISWPDGFNDYIRYVEQMCAALHNFIDEAFGEGVCRELIGPKESLAKLLDVCNAINDALREQPCCFDKPPETPALQPRFAKGKKIVH